MRKSFIIASATAGVLVLAGAGYWLDQSLKSDQAPVTSSGGTVAVLSEQTQAPVKNGVSTVTPQLTTNKQKETTKMENTDFSSYEQHKDETNALFNDLTPGTGAAVEAGKTVTVNYRGWLTNGTVFDESYKRGQPFSFAVGQHQVITGWDTGLIGMKVGGKRRLVVPPAVGYGANPTGPIPANSVLVFDIELLDVK